MTTHTKAPWEGNNADYGKPVVLFLFNTSEHAVSPWLERGEFTCLSVDLQNPTWEQKGDHIRASLDVLT